MSLHLREYQDSDLEMVVRMWHDSKRAAYKYVPVQQAYTLDDDRSFFLDVIIRKCDVWLAEQASQIDGMLAINGDLVDQLFVRTGKWGQGIGAALINHAQLLSPSALRAYTFQKNLRARGFYEKNGFKAIKFGISPPPENEPDVLYAWIPNSSFCPWPDF